MLSPRMRVADPVEPTHAGIGGWLVLPALGLVFAVLLEGYGTWPLVKAFAIAPSLDLLFALVLELPWIAYMLVVAAFFIRKHRWTPYLYIVLLLGSVGFSGLLLILHVLAPAEEIQDTPRELTRAIIQASIWIPYFLRSRRVKLTFVNAW